MSIKFKNLFCYNKSDRVYRAGFLFALAFSVMLPIFSGWYFYWGQFFFIFWVFTLFVCGRFDIKSLIVFLAIISYFLFNATYNLSIDNAGYRFLQDSVKVFVIVSSVYIITKNVSFCFIRLLIKYMIKIFPIIFFSFFFFIKSDDWFSYSGRLYDPLFGSPNVLGVFCSLAVLYILAFKETLSTLLFFVLLAFYVIILFAGFSRAAIIALCFSIPFLLNSRDFLFLITFAIFAIFAILFFMDISQYLPSWVLRKSDIINDIKETGGSNRLMIWGEAIAMQLDSVSSFLFGGGPGRVITTLKYGGIVDHPHNFYLFIFWAYGLIGFVLFFFIWMGLFFSLLKYFKWNSAKFLCSLFVFYTLIFLMDTHILSSQYLVQHILFLSMIFSFLRMAKRDRNSEKALSQADSGGAQPSVVVGRDLDGRPR